MPGKCTEESSQDDFWTEEEKVNRQGQAVVGAGVVDHLGGVEAQKEDQHGPGL